MYGMPAEGTLKLSYKWPHHGVFNLGGCVVGDGLDEDTVKDLVRDDCTQAMEKALKD